MAHQGAALLIRVRRGSEGVQCGSESAAWLIRVRRGSEGVRRGSEGAAWLRGCAAWLRQ